MTTVRRCSSAPSSVIKHQFASCGASVRISATDYGSCKLDDDVRDGHGCSSETIREKEQQLFSISILLSSLCSLFLSNWISAPTRVSASAARQAGGEMTPQGENQKQLHLWRIGLVFVLFLFFTGGPLAGRGRQKEKKRKKMRQDDADVGSSKSLRKSVASWESS